MRVHRQTLVGAVLGVLGIAALAGAQPPRTTEKVERGRYLVSVIGCGDCHTPGTFAGGADSSRSLSGSEYGWSGPWGTTFAANLTPHETGLATWSEADIVTAIRAGLRPDGTRLRPPMPVPALANLSDEDAFAIASYLRTLPPIDHQEPAYVAPDQPMPAGIATIQFSPPPAWDAPLTGAPAKGAR